MAYAVNSLVGILLAVCIQATRVGAGETCYYTNSIGKVIRLYCQYSDCCGVNNYRYCCHTSHTAVIVGGVLGFLFLVGIAACIVSCCFCACCPIYQNRVRSRGVVITTTGTHTVPTNYNTINWTTQPTAGPYMGQPPKYQY
ncbi:uncharacterized protein LOC127867608 [Dreissena polymorpha]|uniref:Uncharacterized protein n=1 Tax=Dreissena polymorpha TaxID=45954 RepID=A0A9D4NF33_DREPO|nr:uncharacterized protein LOC127867608 [Dreissena polymorpha]KAH3893156.1 hypothetical protein DPMN_017300 [Dreissena polymorpha]